MEKTIKLIDLGLMPCNACESEYGVVKDNGVHTELRCDSCGGHIKMLNKKEKALLNAFGDSKPYFPHLEALQEMNFKLDLIINHLGIKNEE